MNIIYDLTIYELLHSGQAEKEFRVEVEAIGHVRHKNLVRLLGYCIEGVHRYFQIKLWNFSKYVKVLYAMTLYFE